MITAKDKNLILLASFNWFLLSFLAGSVNAGGYLACHRFVTHVTGFATLFGVEAVSGTILGALGILSVPVFFLAGSMLSAFLIDRRFHRGQIPRYGLVMALIFACLAISTFGGIRGWFGVFGGEIHLARDYGLLALLCLASGLQNAAITTSSGFAIRTTHLTGITTDLAIGLVRAGSMGANYAAEMRNNWLRMGTITAFMLGSVIGVCIFLQWQYWGFLLPAMIALYECFMALRFKKLFTARHAWLKGEAREV